MEVVPDNHVVGKLVSMLDLFRDDPGRTDFAEVWRNFSYMQVREQGLLGLGPWIANWCTVQSLSACAL